MGECTNSASAPPTLIEQWDGSAWTITPSPSPGTKGNVLTSVACTSANACTAVGYSFDGIGSNTTLIESWDGNTWSVVPSPNAAGAASSLLSSVACTSPTSCIAVGYWQAASMTQQGSLVESWDGASWSIVPSPSPGASGTFLDSVACTSPTACTAVGSSRDSGSPTTLVESWNGTSWSVVPSPSPGSGESELHAVACPSPSSCAAVGGYTTSFTLAESWNGSSWSIVPSKGSSAVLFSVACTSPAACMAVGRQGGGAATLAESWNGTSWSIVPSPTPSGATNVGLAAVACPSASFCVAVGSDVPMAVSVPLIEIYQ